MRGSLLSVSKPNAANGSHDAAATSRRAAQLEGPEAPAAPITCVGRAEILEDGELQETASHWAETVQTGWLQIDWRVRGQIMCVA